MALLVSELEYTFNFRNISNCVILEDVDLYFVTEDISSCINDEQINQMKSIKIKSLQMILNKPDTRDFSKSFKFSYLFEPGKPLILKVFYTVTKTGINKKYKYFTIIKSRIGTEYWREMRTSIEI